MLDTVADVVYDGLLPGTAFLWGKCTDELNYIVTDCGVLFSNCHNSFSIVTLN